MDSLTIAGFMSGTSMDGLDCCIARISMDSSYVFNYEIIAQESFDFDTITRNQIKNYIGQTKKDKINEIDSYLGEKFLVIILDFKMY